MRNSVKKLGQIANQSGNGGEKATMWTWVNNKCVCT